jgi:hypothetical protein
MNPKNCVQSLRGKLTRCYRRGWNDALRTILSALDEDFGDEEELTRHQNVEICQGLWFRSYEVRSKTNRELADSYGCSPRTIQYWRSQGAPLEQPRRAMIRWLARRPRLPRRTESRLGKRLALERIRAGIARLGSELVQDAD